MSISEAVCTCNCVGEFPNRACQEIPVPRCAAISFHVNWGSECTYVFKFWFAYFSFIWHYKTKQITLGIVSPCRELLMTQIIMSFLVFIADFRTTTRMILRITQLSVWFACQISVTLSYCPVDISACVTAVLTHYVTRLTTVLYVELRSAPCCSSEQYAKKSTSLNQKIM